MENFNSLNLEKTLMDAIAVINFKTPTPIQAQAIPVALEGKDILGTAQTGTGKTAAFGIPLVNFLLKTQKDTALVMTPTRELATQVMQTMTSLIGRGNIRTALLIGGDSMQKQLRQMQRNPRLIVGAQGVYLKDHLGRLQIDASSGLYCKPLGHGRKEIITAVTQQLEQLDYCQPFHQGFGGSFELATKIANQTPDGLNKIFYTICGSTAVESAIKIAFTYHRLNGNEKRYRFVGREKGYHGMNIGAMSVGGMPNNIKGYDNIMMPGVLRMRHTQLPDHKFVEGQPDTGVELANDLEKIC